MIRKTTILTSVICLTALSAPAQEVDAVTGATRQADRTERADDSARSRLYIGG